jgi:hypothetical protein
LTVTLTKYLTIAWRPTCMDGGSVVLTCLAARTKDPVAGAGFVRQLLLNGI